MRVHRAEGDHRGIRHLVVTGGKAEGEKWIVHVFAYLQKTKIVCGVISIQGIPDIQNTDSYDSSQESVDNQNKKVECIRRT